MSDSRTPFAPLAAAGDVLVPFPAAKILCARTARDEVAVTQAGETIVYDTEAELHEAVRRADPDFARLKAAYESGVLENAAIRKSAEADAARASVLLEQAMLLKARVAAEVADLTAQRDAARLTLRQLWLGVILGGAGGLIAALLITWGQA